MLTHEAAVALKLIPAETDEKTVAVVISHDCDLAANPNKEPDVEVIRGSLIEGPKGQFTHSKNARTVHLPFSRGGGQQWVELHAREKCQISKRDLAPFYPRTDLKLDAGGRFTLQRWLAARYRRAAFPEAFEDRLKKKSGLAEELAAILEPHGQNIRSILFDLDEGRNEERTDPWDTYSLRIYILYKTAPDPEIARRAAEQVQSEIETTFRRKLFEPSKQWIYIELSECVAVADEVLTVAEAELLREWRLEHMSLQEDPPQPMLPD